MFELTFEELRPQIHEADTAEQEVIGIGTAEEWAQEHPSNALIILQDDQIEGRLFAGGTLGGDPFPGSSMSGLYGDYINTHEDARADWQPSGGTLPACPYCQYQGYQEYRLVSGQGSFYCKNCNQKTAEGV